MKKYEVIKDKREFNNIIQNSKYIKNKYFTIYFENSKLNKTRFGIAISTKFGKAHIRNYYKRITRNIIDLNKNMFSNNKDYIIMIKRTCLEKKYKDLLISFNELLKEIR